MDKITLGSSPYGVEPAQVGTEGYYERCHRELKAYKGQLLRHYAENHGGAKLPCKLGFTENPHDYGNTVREYYEVEAFYSDQRTAEAAFWLANNIPEDWDRVAGAELGLAPGDDLVPYAEVQP